MRQLCISIGDDFMLADPGRTARAPGHNIHAAVDPALLPTFLKKCPDHIIVFVGEGEIAATQLGQAQAANNLLYRTGYRPLWAFYSDYFVRILQQLFC